MSAVVTRPKTCPQCDRHFDADALYCPKDGSLLRGEEDPDEPARDPYLETVIAGDIEIRSVAGVGAMGKVYRAHQRGIDRDVAVKILHRELSSNAQLIGRFHREAKIASKLQHPHVVEVFLAGQLPDGALYMVMEYLDGGSLAQAIKAAGGTIPIERTIPIALQVCDAVGAGHARGIVHRDLKPENVMLVRRADVAEWVKVLDFGIAKLTLGEQTMETAAGLVFGTARYISPEGAQGRQVGPPGDVYALATMLYQMLVGRTPFEAEPLGLLIKHIHEIPPDIRTVNAAGKTVPEPIAKLVMDNLAKEPEARAPNARALAAALAAAAKDANLEVSDVGVIARLSHLPAPSSGGRSSVGAIDPTLDDASATPAIVVGTPGTPAMTQTQPLVPPVATRPSTPMPEPAPADGPEKKTTARGGWSFPSVVGAFVLGIALSAGLLYGLVFRPDAERQAWRERTRAALAEGHYVLPPKENVLELVEVGLQRWPEDVELRQMRSAAEKEMITMAMAARASGDLVGARNLARDALRVEGTDNSARYMKAQTEEELAAATSATPSKVGPPRLVFDSPPLARPGERVTLSGRIVWGASTPAPLTGVKFSLHPNGRADHEVPVHVVSTEPGAIKAWFDAPTPASYDLAFEANAAGTIVRAMRDVDVATP